MRDGGSGSAKAGSLLIAWLLIVPLAMAAASTGDFVTRGGISFDGAATETFPAAALFLNDTSRLDIAGYFPTARVCEYEWHALEVTVIGPILNAPYQKEGPCFDQSDLRLSLIPGNQAGWAGIHPRGGSLDFASGGAAGIEPRSSASLTSPNANGASVDNGATERESANNPWFMETALEPRAFVNQTGTATYHGPAELKLMGPDVTLQSSTNTTEYHTEDSATSAPAHERFYRWLVISFESGSVTLTSDTAPFQIVAPSARVAFDGTASFTADSGSVTVAGIPHDADAGLLTVIDGRLSASVAPSATGDKLAVKLDGDARSVNLGSARIVAPKDQAGLPWGLVALGVGLAFATGGAALLVAKKHHAGRSHARVPPARRRVSVFVPVRQGNAVVALVVGSPGDRATAYEERADRLADARSWLEAADLYGKVRQMDPARPKVAMKQGVALFHAGRPRTALSSFHDAALPSDDGDAETWAARCLVRLGDTDAAEAVFLAGLARSPTAETLDTMETHADLAALRERTNVRAALDAAWERSGAS